MFENEQARRVFIEKEKNRYAINLSDEIPKISPNLGIRKKLFDKTSRKYVELTDLLKELYNHFSPNFDQYDIYSYFQKIEPRNRIVRDCNNFAESIENLSKEIPCWAEARVNTDSIYWVQVCFYRKEDKDKIFPNRPHNIKVYACLKNTHIKSVFTDSLQYLLKKAQNNFCAKIALCNRNDQMCYWLSAGDFKHLEDFYRQFANDMVKSLPFVAYKGKLGISREFRDVYSHNAMLALIITDYLKNIQSVDEIDLADMYNNYIKKWNADIYEDGYSGCEFKYQSVLSFITILDTLDCLLNMANISDKSLMMSGDEKIWNIFANSCCWADVNERWQNDGVPKSLFK